MWFKLQISLALILASTAIASPYKLLCHYNSSSYLRDGVAKLENADLEPALSLCTHLIYGHFGIDPDFRVVSLNPDLDLDEGCGHVRKIVDLKQKFPHLKILLSIGGGIDRINGQPNVGYRELLLDDLSQLVFINSAHVLVQKYGFDGIDLAWQFPTQSPIKPKTGFSAIWKGVKTFLGTNRQYTQDWEDAQDYRVGFTSLLEELYPAFRRDNLIVSVSVLPQVKMGLFLEFHKIFPILDYLTLPTYDLWTPQQHPEEAFHPAWLQHNSEFGSIEDLIVYSRGQNNEHVNKTIFAIQSYGRTWQLEKSYKGDGLAPIYGLRRPGAAGPVTQTPGLLSYPEICANLEDADNRIVQYERMPLMNGNETNGAYALRLADREGNNGIWIGYEDPAWAGKKTALALGRGAAGVALVDLGYDDFRGTCGGEKYGILKAIRSALDGAEFDGTFDSSTLDPIN